MITSKVFVHNGELHLSEKTKVSSRFFFLGLFDMTRCQTQSIEVSALWDRLGLPLGVMALSSGTTAMLPARKKEHLLFVKGNGFFIFTAHASLGIGFHIEVGMRPQTCKHTRRTRRQWHAHTWPWTHKIKADNTCIHLMFTLTHRQFVTNTRWLPRLFCFATFFFATDARDESHFKHLFCGNFSKVVQKNGMNVCQCQPGYSGNGYTSCAGEQKEKECKDVCLHHPTARHCDLFQVYPGGPRSAGLDSHLTTYIPQVVTIDRCLFIISGVLTLWKPHSNMKYSLVLFLFQTGKTYNLEKKKEVE